jgi:hypothetical protein
MYLYAGSTPSPPPTEQGGEGRPCGARQAGEAAAKADGVIAEA